MLAEFKKLLEEYPDAIQEKKRFKALLYDYFPMKRKEANALYMALEIGIPNNMLELSAVGASDIIRYERQLQYNYGLDGELVLQTIELWAKGLNIEVDYEFLSSKENTEKLDEDIYKKYKKIDNVYQRITMAIKDKFPFVRENYSGTSKFFDDIVEDLFQYDKDKAIEVWLWILNLYWKRLDKDDDSAYTLISGILRNVYNRSDNDAFIDILEKYPLLLKYIFHDGSDMDYQHKELLISMLKKNKVGMCKQSLAYLYEGRKGKQLNADEIIEAVVKGIRPSRGMMLSEEAMGLLKEEVAHMHSDVMKENVSKLLKKKINDVKYFSQGAPSRGSGKKAWDFAALKEKAIEMRKKEPLWNGYKFISFTTVVGIYYRSDKEAILADLKEGDKLFLKRESDNEYDSMAVAVYDSRDRKMGYLPKESNTFMATMMDSGQDFIGRLFSFSKSQQNANIAIEIFIKN